MTPNLEMTVNLSNMVAEFGEAIDGTNAGHVIEMLAKACRKRGRSEADKKVWQQVADELQQVADRRTLKIDK